MLHNALIAKVAGGALAAGMLATAFLGHVAPANADTGPAPNARLSGGQLGVLKPNIKLLGATVSPDKKTATVRFENAGPCATSTGFWISVRFNHLPGYQYLWQPAMAAGESTTRSVSVPASMQNANGTNEIDFLLDFHMGFSPLELVSESNENDNVTALFY